MKKIYQSSLLLLPVCLAFILSQCAKKKEDTGQCKTCKALNTGPDQQTIQRVVCTPEEEQAFRDANPGRQITCQ